MAHFRKDFTVTMRPVERSLVNIRFIRFLIIKEKKRRKEKKGKKMKKNMKMSTIHIYIYISIEEKRNIKGQVYVCICETVKHKNRQTMKAF